MKKQLISYSPAGGWKDGFPVGNGVIAALAYGRICAEVVLLNHQDLWRAGVFQPLPDLSGHLAELRRMMDDGNHVEANQLYPKLLQESGFSGRAEAYQPGPDILFEESAEEAFSQYKRRLDMSTGCITVSWLDGSQPRSRELFTPLRHNVVAIRCSAASNQSIRRSVRLQPHDFADAFDQHGKSFDIPFTVSVQSFEKGYCTHFSFDEPFQDYLCAAFAVGTDSVIHVKDGTLVVEGIGCVEIYVALEPKKNDPRQAEQLYRRLRSVAEIGYEALLLEHSLAFGALFDSCEFSLDATPEERSRSNEELLAQAFNSEPSLALIERMHDYGRYLLICSSCQGALPANLQGKWNGDYSPPWACIYFLNENLQMAYWQAFPGNLAEVLLPIFDLIEKLTGDYEVNARRLFGCDGYLLPLYLGPGSGVQCDKQPHVIYWTGAGAWVAHLYFEYWSFTGDDVFLRERALPFIRQVARFYEQFVIVRDAKAFIYPGNSPENHPLGPWKKGEVDLCINATMDVALVRELFTNLKMIDSRLGTDSPGHHRREAILEALPQYEVDDDGAFREWLHPDFGENHEHRHLSHLYPFFPGHELQPGDASTPLQAIRTSIEKRLEIGIRYQTGWSFAHMANVFARLGEGNHAARCLHLLTKSCTGPNLMTYHNDYRGMGITMSILRGRTPPLQLDANFGYSSAILEMLLHSSLGQITILPALPASWRKGVLAGACCRGGIKVDIEWDLDAKHIRLSFRSRIAAERELILPVGATPDTDASLAPAGGRSYHLRLSPKAIFCVHLQWSRSESPVELIAAL